MRKNIIKLCLVLLALIISVQILSKEYVKGTVQESLPEPIFRVQTEEKEIALTFDINWAENDYLIEILDILDKYEIKSTFFIMGKWVIYPDGNKEKLIEIHTRGHEIANHSYVHPDFSKINNERAVEEVKKTSDIIYENIGVKTELFRYPSGYYNENSKKAIESTNHISIQWDVDSVDWKESGADIEYKRVMDKVKPGSIVLFHNNAKYTPQNLEKIIINMKKEGYNFIKVSDLIYRENYFINENGEQNKKK